MHRLALILLIALIVPVTLAQPPATKAFQPSCAAIPITLPHPTTFAAVDGVDTGDCGMTGEPADAPHDLQNTAKDNLCASGTRAEITEVTLRALQKASSKITVLPASRTSLPHRTTSNGDRVGDGSLVMMTGWLLRAKGTGAESVNCSATDAQHTDIHLAIAQDPTETNECFSSTAEMIPHYRPSAWTPSTMHFLAKLKPKKRNKNDTLEYTDYDTDNRPPVRVTGQLFFDGSHKVCNGGTALTGQPPRYSNWEIHPVYNLEVCTAANMDDCTVDNDDVWTNFTTWHENH